MNNTYIMFRDRKDAGQKLAQSLEKYKNDDLFVLALPRGGVPVGFEIAKKFNAPFDVVVVRKLGLPYQPELGFGAIAPGIMILNDEVLGEHILTESQIEYVKTKEETELARRMKEYRDEKSIYDLKDKTVIIVDDGIATGITMLAAIRYVKSLNPKRVIVACPVFATDTLQLIRAETDDIVCLLTPFNFSAVGEWYENFPQVSDEEVKALLRK